MMQGHAHSAMTMNFVRALIDGGFADLHHPEYWNLAWVEHSPLAAEYRQMVDGICESPCASWKPWPDRSRISSASDFFTSHEALLLPYEQALTRQVPRHWGWFNLSTHFPWIGMRTAALDGAHVEYLPRHPQSDRGQGRPFGARRTVAAVDGRSSIRTTSPDGSP